MKSIIIDDEKIARAIVERHIVNNPDLSLTGEFSNAMEAIKHLNQHSVDLIFLDIHMPNFNGFDLIQTLKSPPKVILTTSDKQFAIDAFEYDCIVDYLVKPITKDRFNKAILKASTSSKTTDINQNSTDIERELYINIDRRLIKLDMNTIKLIEARGDYIIVKTEEKNYTVHCTLKKIQEKLPEDLFLKIHRSYIINTQKIIDIEDNSVLIGNDVIPVSRSNRPNLLQRLNLL
ncbi:MAG: DNA-binding response regulator [Flavobacteriaceae bacterium]|nr:MAG: DNA-binding response regulator [Flavobacteriaceae bacterium]